MIEIIQQGDTIEIKSKSILDVKEGTNHIDIYKAGGNTIEIKSKSILDVKEVTNHIDIYKAGILGAGGGDSLWQVGAGDLIEPKFNKKVDATTLSGELSGGIFQP